MMTHFFIARENGMMRRLLIRVDNANFDQKTFENIGIFSSTLNLRFFECFDQNIMFLERFGSCMASSSKPNQ
jgi:hypothetical protein